MGYPSGHETTGAMSGIFNLNVGDYVEVYYQSGGSGDIYGVDNMQNGWTGHLIG